MMSGGPLAATGLAALLADIAQDAIRLGFTGHEHDDQVGLVNMKGRLYDAELGRFISADPHVQNATDTQSYNRYTYVKNNPLSYTDPSGYFFKKLFRSIGKFFKKWGRTILAIAVGVITAGAALYAYAGTAAFGAQTLSAIYAANGLGAALVGGAIAGGVGAFTSTLVATGSIKEAFAAGIFGAISGALAFGIGHGGFIGGGKAGIAVAHGVAQGTVSVLRGGKFKSGFAGGFFGHMAGGTFKGKNIYTRTAFSAAVGGTISKAVGGKFANGAVSAAFTHLFNNEAADRWREEAQSQDGEIPRWHSHRNENNRAPTSEPVVGIADSEGRVWKFHSLLEKYYSADGMEAKYMNGLLMSDVNGNYTYNYGVDKWTIKHFTSDVFPHYQYGGGSSYENGLTTTY